MHVLGTLVAHIEVCMRPCLCVQTHNNDDEDRDRDENDNCSELQPKRHTQNGRDGECVRDGNSVSRGMCAVVRGGFPTTRTIG